jgi:hypothetical protein
MNARIFESQRLCERFWERVFSLPGIELHLILSLLTIPTELPRYICVKVFITCDHICIVCLIIINADWSTVGTLLGLNTHSVFLLCSVYMVQRACNFMCCVLL